MVEKCCYYNLKRKKELKYILNIENKQMEDLVNNYKVFINNGTRLVETPRANLKKVQKTIKKHLYKVDIPEWVKSQKGFSYVDNGKYHLNMPYMLALDLKSFFPNSHREFVYKLFNNKFQMSSDTACILTDLTTIDLNEYIFINEATEKSVKNFINRKKIASLNHIPTGSPISTCLSYLAFSDMFNEIKVLLNDDMKMSLYVDDLTISSNSFINKKLISQIEQIISKYNHRLSLNKTRLYSKNTLKKITGTRLSNKDGLRIPSKLHQSIYFQFTKYLTIEHKNKSQKEEARKKLYGSVLAARQIIPNSFGYIYGIAKNRIL